jgi:hypothetical protein
MSFSMQEAVMIDASKNVSIGRSLQIALIATLIQGAERPLRARRSYRAVHFHRVPEPALATIACIMAAISRLASGCRLVVPMGIVQSTAIS